MLTYQNKLHHIATIFALCEFQSCNKVLIIGSQALIQSNVSLKQSLCQVAPYPLPFARPSSFYLPTKHRNQRNALMMLLKSSQHLLQILNVKPLNAKQITNRLDKYIVLYDLHKFLKTFHDISYMHSPLCYQLQQVGK